MIFSAGQVCVSQPGSGLACQKITGSLGPGWIRVRHSSVLLRSRSVDRSGLVPGTIFPGLSGFSVTFWSCEDLLSSAMVERKDIHTSIVLKYSLANKFLQFKYVCFLLLYISTPPLFNRVVTCNYTGFFI